MTSTIRRIILAVGVLVGAFLCVGIGFGLGSRYVRGEADISSAQSRVGYAQVLRSRGSSAALAAIDGDLLLSLTALHDADSAAAERKERLILDYFASHPPSAGLDLLPGFFSAQGNVGNATEMDAWLKANREGQRKALEIIAADREAR